MQRIFLPPDQFSSSAAWITGADHLHLTRVLRARPGQRVLLLDNQGNAFQAVLVTIDKLQTLAEIESRIIMPPEPTVRITVAQALGKGDKFEQVVQHGTEAGACAFVPVRAERCVADLPAKREAERLLRWRQIAKSAAEQSGRTYIPEIYPPVRLTELAQTAGGTILLLHPADDAVSLRSALQEETVPPSRLLLAVGPEGGWSPAETQMAEQQGGRTITLGPHILRTETAALVAVSQILYHFQPTSPLPLPAPTD